MTGQFAPLDKVVAVINPHSRISTATVISRLQRNRPEGAELVIRLTTPGLPVSEQIEEDLHDSSLAIAVGGDGTVSEVAFAILGKSIPVGIIPTGTTNMVAKVSGVPSNWESALKLIFGIHRRERIDVGRTSDRALLHLGGAGVDARTFEGTQSSLKRLFRWLAYAPPAIRSIAYPSSRCVVTVDDESIEVDSRMVLVANSARLISPHFQLYPGTSRQDGKFDVLIFTADSVPEIVRTSYRFVTQGLHRSPYLIAMRGTSIAIEADPQLPVELDGDLAGQTPVSITVDPLALELICGEKVWN